MIAVEPVRHHARHQVGELPVFSGFGQGGTPDVIAEIEVQVVDPDRRPEAERYGVQLLAVAGQERQAVRDERHDLLMGRRRTLEHGNRRDRHRRVLVLVLRIDEHGVQRL